MRSAPFWVRVPAPATFQGPVRNAPSACTTNGRRSSGPLAVRLRSRTAAPPCASTAELAWRSRSARGPPAASTIFTRPPAWPSDSSTPGPTANVRSALAGWPERSEAAPLAADAGAVHLDAAEIDAPAGEAKRRGASGRSVPSAASQRNMTVERGRAAQEAQYQMRVAQRQGRQVERREIGDQVRPRTGERAADIARTLGRSVDLQRADHQWAPRRPAQRELKRTIAADLTGGIGRTSRPAEGRGGKVQGSILVVTLGRQPRRRAQQVIDAWIEASGQPLALRIETERPRLTRSDPGSRSRSP